MLALYFHNIGRLRTFGATGNFEFNFLIYFQGLESFALDGREVHEHIFSIFLGNEAIAFGVIEPLYLTLSQTVPLLLMQNLRPARLPCGSAGHAFVQLTDGLGNSTTLPKRIFSVKHFSRRIAAETPVAQENGRAAHLFCP